MFSTVTAILFPLFMVVALGYLLARRLNPDFSQLNRINMLVFVPALVFSSLLSLDLRADGASTLVMAGTLAILLPGLLCWPICRITGASFRLWGPTQMFRNSGNLGIPLFLLAFGDRALDFAVLLFALSNVLHLTLGLAIFQGRFSLKGMASAPLLPAALLGIGANLADIAVWPPLVAGTELAGQAAIPIMLLALGGQLIHLRRQDIRLGLGATAVSLLSGAVAFVVVDSLFDLSLLQRQMLLLFTLLPPAVINFLFAQQYQVAPQKMSAIILFSNFATVLTLPLILTLALSLG
ncbi:AEC family transporter [Ferrimonas marina]|uniref:AEC family transporter n=1 Tax=Ferrimonas marina TaxID=299255 RepID=A0A1M5VLC7_9GAMM|nr:AEC family transporter [Ferrimonas marina]SHH76039.1 hypothetical protein SAMN02745129_2841 [Ferrimonas marina]